MNRKIISLSLILNFILVSQIYSQETGNKKFNFGVRYSYSYDYKAIHHTPTFFFGINNHDIYAGPEYTIIRESLGDPIDTFEKSVFGLNLGYRYYFQLPIERMKLFLQFNFSFYPFKYSEYQLGYPNITEQCDLIIENTLSFGGKYQLVKRLFIFGGLGFGSDEGFFFLLNSFIPYLYTGMEFKF